MFTEKADLINYNLVDNSSPSFYSAYAEIEIRTFFPPWMLSQHRVGWTERSFD